MRALMWWEPNKQTIWPHLLLDSSSCPWHTTDIPSTTDYDQHTIALKYTQSHDSLNQMVSIVPFSTMASLAVASHFHGNKGVYYQIIITIMIWVTTLRNNIIRNHHSKNRCRSKLSLEPVTREMITFSYWLYEAPLVQNPLRCSLIA